MIIYIYGTGRYATNFLNYTQKLEDEVAGFIETKKSKNIYRGKPVYTPAEIKEYDLIVVASQFVYEIKETLYMSGCDLRKVIFLARSWIPVEASHEGIKYHFEKACNYPVDSAVFFELSAIYTTSSSIAELFKGDICPETFWESIDKYQTDVNAPHIFCEQRNMLDYEFIPKINRSDIVCDIGCASGEWSRYVSPYVKSVEGFDISEPMINTAKDYSIEYGYSNINYLCINALDIDYSRIYDHALILGVGIYLKIDALNAMVKNISKYIKKGGYVAVRDTMSMYTDKTVYMVRKEKGNLFEEYTANYIPIKLYEQIYINNGFRKVEERYFCSYFHEPIELGAHGFIFERI